ncbi:MAG: hypothetical protein J6I73_07445 [Treponema sp.]|nr:hypothetical protein [Treponema sp.]
MKSNVDILHKRTSSSCIRELRCVLCALFLACIPLYAEERALAKQSEEAPRKILGCAVGGRTSYISYAGLEPTVSLIASRFEAETSCIISFVGMTYGYNKAGVAPRVSLGYTSDMFSSGWKHGVGATYQYFSHGFREGLLLSVFTPFKSKEMRASGNYKHNFEYGDHIFSLYYKSGWQFKNRLGIYFRLSLPLVAFGRDMKDAWGAPVISAFMEKGAGFGYAFLASLASQSIGIRYVF